MNNNHFNSIYSVLVYSLANVNCLMIGLTYNRVVVKGIECDSPKVLESRINTLTYH